MACCRVNPNQNEGLNLFVHRLFELAELTGGEDKQRRSCFAMRAVQGGGVEEKSNMSWESMQHISGKEKRLARRFLSLEVHSTPVAHSGSAWPEKPGQVLSRRLLKSWTLLKIAACEAEQRQTHSRNMGISIWLRGHMICVS